MGHSKDILGSRAPGAHCDQALLWLIRVILGVIYGYNIGVKKGYSIGIMETKMRTTIMGLSRV